MINLKASSQRVTAPVIRQRISLRRIQPDVLLFQLSFHVQHILDISPEAVNIDCRRLIYGVAVVKP